MYSKLYSYQYWRTLLLSGALMLTLLLSGCSTLGSAALGGLLGDGPSANANVQAGKTNSQTIGTTTVTDSRIVNPQADTIEQDNSSTTNNTLPPWLIIAGMLLLIVGWVTDTPKTMLEGFRAKK